MGRPCQHHLGTLRFLMFFNRDEVSKCLKGVCRSTFHREHGFAAILDKLVEHVLRVVFLTVGESRKSAYADNVAERSHHGNRFQKVFALIAVHNYATLCFQLPSALIYVEHNDIES